MRLREPRRDDSQAGVVDLSLPRVDWAGRQALDDQIPLSGLSCLAPSVTPEGSGRHCSLMSAFCCENTGVETDFGEEFTASASMQFSCVVYSKGLLLHFPVGCPGQIHRYRFSA